MRFSSTVNQAAFTAPPSAIKDAQRLGRLSSVTVPFTVVEGHILIHVSMNGRTAVPFLLDTGGRNRMTPKAATHFLGGKGSGNIPLNGIGRKLENAHFATVSELRLGAVQMLNELFVISPLP